MRCIFWHVVCVEKPRAPGLSTPVHAWCIPSAASPAASHPQTFIKRLHSKTLTANRVKMFDGAFYAESPDTTNSRCFHRKFLPTVHWAKEKV